MDSKTSTDKEAVLSARFAQLKQAAARNPYPSRQERDERLAELRRLLHDNIAPIGEAIRQDFGNRSFHETQLLEFFPSLEAIRHARRHLGAWMKPHRRRVSLWYQPGRARVIHQPLGVAGIIVPWNYPVLLAIGPLVAALAAGNRVMIKMSEFTPATSALLADLCQRHLPTDWVDVVQGDSGVAQAFARLPFGHLLFTGSTQVGYSVARAAAENLTPVTLELGGKSAAILGPGFPMRRFAERVMFGKTMNAGQTCVAPDYVMVPAGREQEFLAAARHAVARSYPDLMRTPDYSTIVSDRHYRRVTGLLDEAREQGAEVVPLAQGCDAPDPATRRVPPFALLDTHAGMRVMQEEIFGPLLPVIPYQGLDEALRHVNERPNPLALYYFDTDRERVERVLRETLSGGVTINDTILHIAQDNLPFGGVGESGQGHYHGYEGFETFSKKKGVFHQSHLSGVGLFSPPYRRRFTHLIKLLLR